MKCSFEKKEKKVYIMLKKRCPSKKNGSANRERKSLGCSLRDDIVFDFVSYVYFSRSLIAT